MNIKLRLTLWFTLIVAAILLSSFYIVYQNYTSFRRSSFYQRLNDRSRLIADNYYESQYLNQNHLQVINDYNFGINSILRVSLYNENGSLIKAIGASIPWDEKTKQNLTLDSSIEVEIQDTQYVYFKLPTSTESIIVFSAAYDNVGLEKVQFLRNLFVLIWVIAVCTTAFAGWWFAKLSLNPIMQIVTKVNKITALNLHTRIKKYHSKDEIAILSNTFNQMLDRLESSFSLQKNFVANASHEFRTPLTALKGQIQVALLKPRSTQEYETLLRSLNDDINNVINLLNALQQLAIANANFPLHAFQKTSILDALVDARDELLKNKPEYKIELSIQQNDDDTLDSFYCMGDVNLLKSALSNLMENGCKFSPDLAVKIAFTPASEKLIIQFIDEGVGIAPENIGHIFEPFFRANDTRHIYGNGIGLSLVKRIIEIHNGTIEVTSELGKGAIFTIKIPTINSI